jgi:hypothetical protein
MLSTSGVVGMLHLLHETLGQSGTIADAAWQFHLSDVTGGTCTLTATRDRYREFG